MFQIFVLVWCEIDPTLNVRVDRQSGGPVADTGDVLRRVSPLGRLGVHAAVQLVSGMDPESTFVIPFAIGAGHREALRYAMAEIDDSGGVELTMESAPTDAVPIAAVVEWLRVVRPNLVIADRRAGELAGLLGWSHLAGLESLGIQPGFEPSNATRRDRLRAIRHLGRGDREEVMAAFPAVIRLQDGTLRPPYLSRSRVQAIPEDWIKVQTLPSPPGGNRQSATDPLQPFRPRVRATASSKPPATSATDRMQALLGLGKPAAVAPARPTAPNPSTPDAQAEEFLRYLAHHQLLPDVDRA